jgi:hypothetical protein
MRFRDITRQGVFMDKLLSEYGEELNLMDILEQLGTYCLQNFGNPNEIKIILPKKVLEEFSAGPNTIRTVPTTWSGRIELFNADDNEVTMKDKG